MNSPIFRALRSALVLWLSFGLVAPSLGAEAKLSQNQAAVSKPAKSVPWLYVGSDIPPDPAWTFGVLPNGVRYAVRRNGVPPGQVSIRVDIEAGSMMERESERGYAHFIEHLSFHGSRYVADGESIKIWQRLGATFGSDTNASTTNTQTIYKLDLPNATRSGLEESVKILSGMMSAPELKPEQIESERRTVLAEAREQAGPETRAGDATRAHYFAGQLLGTRSPIGTTETLNAATSASLRAFHDRWYRPERAIVVIVGDGNPALFEQMISKYFSGWRGNGPSVPDPDFGKPDPKAPSSLVITEPGVPLIVSLAIQRPWVQKSDTIVYNQGRLVELVALRLINRRLEERARAGGSFLQAGIERDDIARSVDGTFVQIVPLGDDWQSAVRDVRAVIADALANPSAQADIDREAGEFFAALQVGVETQRTEAGAKQADDLIEAVNIRETVASAQVALDVFSGIKNKITPEAIRATTRALFAGVGPRAVLTGRTPVVGGNEALAAAINAPVTAVASTSTALQGGFDQLPSLGKAGKIKKREPITDLGMEQIKFANGVNMLLYANPAETGKIYIQVRFGRGLQALPSSEPTVAWAGSVALLAGGVGNFDQNALDRVTSGRRINSSFDIGENAFVLRAQTRAADLTDQLKLLASQITSLRWDAAPVQRARAAFLTNYDTLGTSPQSVLSRDLSTLLHGGDARWSTPSREAITALTPQAFRKFWEPFLKTGPIEILVFGDIAADDAVAAVGETFGALKKRSAASPLAGSAGSRGPAATTTPIVRFHTGPADQAAAVLAYPLGGGAAGLYESRKLELLSSIFNDRMFNQFRETEGAGYSPNVNSNWPLSLQSGGSFLISSQLRPDRIDLFYKIARQIADDLATKPVTADELVRAVTPLRQFIARASSGNTFWMGQLAGLSQDKSKVPALRTLSTDYGRITPAELQETAKRWFVQNKAMMLVVKPQGK
ncbi:MAG: insulinase family protein [Pseudomonadota bacterium]